MVGLYLGTGFRSSRSFRTRSEDKRSMPMRRKRKLPPGTRHHEPWCGVFYGKSCDCDDGSYRLQRRPTPLGGGEAPLKADRELEEA